MRRPKCILLDVEGTTSSISFVYDRMFPFVRQRLTRFLTENWNSESTIDALEMVAKDLGHSDRSAWLNEADDAVATASNDILSMMDGDLKATGLKQLQGLIWESGFKSGELVAHLFDDVAESIRRWVGDGIQVQIYSSGSIHAQQLFFGHSIAGNLLPFLSGYFDTSSGGKKESTSYERIANRIGCATGEILFVSDIELELEAARTAGMQVCLCRRPGNHPVQQPEDFPTISSFDELEFEVVTSDHR